MQVGTISHRLNTDNSVPPSEVPGIDGNAPDRPVCGTRCGGLAQAAWTGVKIAAPYCDSSMNIGCSTMQEKLFDNLDAYQFISSKFNVFSRKIQEIYLIYRYFSTLGDLSRENPD
ncbi:hypothetical protein WBP07_26450 [Novosphingobium sp. BL-8A]|uniref:hypothetical protein n=1 Tax=Novosphingobium sp. BL-8A TaxID=3127639 RepID=UPI0037579023